MLTNKEVYKTPPKERRLENEGVATVNDDTNDTQSQAVLRYELSTFVCDGQYERGIVDILDSYLQNLNKTQQQGVWISGFYGSGKSHLAKMLRALWSDFKFNDGITAREIANLSDEVKEKLLELNNAAKREGGLHAASGTLGASAAGSVRLALLKMVFKSVGLPAQYPVAKFVMWLQKEGIFEDVKKQVEQTGSDWDEELDNFYVAEDLHQALVSVKPNLFSTTELCVNTLNNMYPHVEDISNDQMLDAIKEALSKDGKFPLTLIVIDEVQQFISDNSDRSIAVQEMIESCCKSSVGAKIMVVGTGQTAVTGTANLKKLEGRFTLRVELSDADVDSVVRQVILAKKPETIKAIEERLIANSGEITRQLQSTSISHRNDDENFFAADYPILPVRRRFWENTLRALDQTGTDSQLRNQLSLTHKVTQENLDQPIGYVVPADFLYFDSASELLQQRILPRKVYESTMAWAAGSQDEKLIARACGAVFLINKLAAHNDEIGIKATVDTVSDLLVEDLNTGSTEFRNRLPDLMESCELLIKVGDEYRIQTEESAAWNDEFLSQRGQLGSEQHRVENERSDRLRKRFHELVKKKNLAQGQSKVQRTLSFHFESTTPSEGNEVCVWVRDGWTIDENTVRADARQAGTDSSFIFVHLPKRSADDLRRHLIDFKAASITLDKKGDATSPEGIEARQAMETTRSAAEDRINQLLNDSFQGARVLQGGGAEVAGNDLQEMILEAAEASLTRLYPKFQLADQDGWDKVYKKAKEGAPDSLKMVGHSGETDKQSVCKAIISQIGAGKKGSDLRTFFEAAPFGWSRDAIDGGIQALLVDGKITARNDQGIIANSADIERKKLGILLFKIESATVSTPQKIQIRKIFQQAGVSIAGGEELASVGKFLTKMQDLANSAGGDAPKPEPVDQTTLEEIRLASGNEQLLTIYGHRDQLKSDIDAWERTAKEINERLPQWQDLKQLLLTAGSVDSTKEVKLQVEAIEKGRLLLSNPDPIAPLLKSLLDSLRKEISNKQKAFIETIRRERQLLEEDLTWQKLGQEEQTQFLSETRVTEPELIEVSSKEAVLAAIQEQPLNGWTDRIDAVKPRFDQVREKAAKHLEPKIRSFQLPRKTLSTQDDVNAWIEEAAAQLTRAITEGPIILK